MKLSAIAVLFTAVFAAASPLAQRDAPEAAAEVESFLGPAAAASGSAVVVNGTAAGLSEREIEARSKYSWIQWKNNFVWPSGVPVGGNTEITIYSNGNANFKGHFHDSGFPSYDVSVICVLKDVRGRGYTFNKKGRMYGTIDPGSRDFNFDMTKYVPAIKANWADIENGPLLMHCTGHTAVTILLAGITQWLNDILKIAGVVAGIIAVF